MLGFKKFLDRVRSSDKPLPHRKTRHVTVPSVSGHIQDTRSRPSERPRKRGVRTEEAVPANCVGGGGIDGIGVGVKGEPGVPRKRRKSVLLGATMKRTKHANAR